MLVLRGPWDLFKRSSAYGNKGGFISQLPGAPNGWRHLPFARVHRGWRHGLDWGPSKDVPLLQGCIQDLLEGEITLVVVAQVMLIRRILPCRHCPLHLWEFNPEGPRALQHFMGATPVEMYKLFFGSQKMCPDLTEDTGLSCNRPNTQVSSPVPGHAIRISIINLPLKELSLEQEWIAKAKLIRCLAPSLRPCRPLC